jgi:uncharacterized protein (UPF0264 family)
MNRRGLLVSVRDAGEAAAALAGNAAIIDVKEPDRGSLGAACPATIAAVAAVVGQARPWTMACGELLSAGGRDQAAVDQGVGRIADLLDRVWAALSPSAALPAAVKVGLAGAVGARWRAALAGLYAALPPGVTGVAVAYADWQRAEAPPPEEILAAAAECGCRMFLLDTFDKAEGGLFACSPPGVVSAWVAAAHAAGLGVALAGRLSMSEISAAWSLGPEVVALRSAVCSNGRSGAVQADLVRVAVGMGVSTEANAGTVRPLPGSAGVIA